MVREIITPQENSYPLPIPEKYIGKKIEVLLYSLDEISDAKPEKRKKPSDYFGALSKEEAEEMKEYINQSRNEWARNI